MHILKIQKVHLIAGGVTLAIGILTMLESLRYTMGTARSMGPGYFPMILGILAVICGLGIIFYEGPRHTTTELQRPAMRALLAVVAAILAFTFAVDRLGLIPAVFLAALVSSFAEPRPNLRRSIVLAVTLSTFAYLIFNLGLQVQAEAFKWNI